MPAGIWPIFYGRDRRECDFEVDMRIPKFERFEPVSQEWQITKENEMNGSRYYGVRVEGAKFGIGFGSALAITISYSENHSILWAIIDGILSWLYVVYFALFRG